MHTSPNNAKTGRKSQAPEGYVNFRLLRRQSEEIDRLVDLLRQSKPELSKQFVLNEVIEAGIRAVAERAKADSAVTSPV